MGTFNKKEILYGSPVLIPEIAQKIIDEFKKEGYDIISAPLLSNGYDISISKGKMFMAVLGMKTALKISLKPNNNNVLFEANVGIFGQQAIPTVISMFIFWPVLITQVWGLVQQSKLDDRALEIAKKVVNDSKIYETGGEMIFCTSCGRKISAISKFCPECGAKL